MGVSGSRQSPRDRQIWDDNYFASQFETAPLPEISDSDIESEEVLVNAVGNDQEVYVGSHYSQEFGNEPESKIGPLRTGWNAVLQALLPACYPNDAYRE